MTLSNGTEPPESGRSPSDALPRQPDVEPEQIASPPPSLRLYATIAALGLLMLVLAFRRGAHLSDVLVNLGTGLLETVAILLLVDRRLRRSEMAAIRQFPQSVRAGLKLVRPAERAVYRYAEAFLASAEGQVRHLVTREALDRHALDLDRGLTLLGVLASGKSTWLQKQAAIRAGQFLVDPLHSRAPVLYPLHNWSREVTLKEALRQHVSKFRRTSTRVFHRAMVNGRYLVILDGVDEVPDGMVRRLREEFAELRRSYPSVVWVISSRPGAALPIQVEPVVNVEPPTEAEVEAFMARRRAGLI